MYKCCFRYSSNKNVLDALENNDFALDFSIVTSGKTLLEIDFQNKSYRFVDYDLSNNKKTVAEISENNLVDMINTDVNTLEFEKKWNLFLH
jgi:Holliday junction resolvase